MPWSQLFDDPIFLPDGRVLTTLEDAGHYIAGLSPALQRRPEWQTAAEALLLVAERGGPAMFARIGMMRALNADKPNPQLTPRRKPTKKYRVVK